jgi:hypothetical protein
MIIKSKSRKIGNFDQLYDYMKKGAEKHDNVHVFSRNVYSQDRDGVLNEFTENAQLFNKRKNSVYQRVSLPRNYINYPKQTTNKVRL